ncbi:competence protein ComA [Ignicoccus pacificus DSM 13166]|uniref:Competence protein ComA n=1 Tax=Ignicoccus pacificus DSM 13166 TaxID=940294 RepID=A0A977K9N6_9CREN|nr:competence protein ComA [Ignicoccus pacificus DSM 13166]
MSSLIFNKFWKAAIVVIGNEILIGRVLDTNSYKIAKMLTMIGYDVTEIRKVRDDVEVIAKTIKELMLDNGVIITTGGLGPTYDDLTAEALAYAVGSPLCLKDDALEMVRERLEKMGLKLDDTRKKMAIIPCISVPIPNPVGVAPGIALFTPRTKIFSLPGVPKEMEAMMEKYVLPILEKENLMVRAEACERLEGVREADIAPMIAEFAKEHPEIYVKTHPGIENGKSFVKLCIMASAESKEEAERRAKSLLKNLLNRIAQSGAL